MTTTRTGISRTDEAIAEMKDRNQRALIDNLRKDLETSRALVRRLMAVAPRYHIVDAHGNAASAESWDRSSFDHELDLLEEIGNCMGRPYRVALVEEESNG